MSDRADILGLQERLVSMAALVETADSIGLLIVEHEGAEEPVAVAAEIYIAAALDELRTASTFITNAIRHIDRLVVIVERR